MHASLPQPLRLIYRDIGETTDRIMRERPWWPCRKGCGYCCYLMAAPVASEYEWEHALDGINALPLPLRRTVIERARRFGDDPERSGPGGTTACPFLEDGACSIYPYRPAVCRAYGLYTYRGRGHWCELVEGALAEHADEADEIVLGNMGPVQTALDRLDSPPVLLPAWLERQVQAGSIRLDDECGA